MQLFHRMSLLRDDTVHGQGNYNSNNDDNTLSTLITGINIIAIMKWIAIIACSKRCKYAALIQIS